MITVIQTFTGLPFDLANPDPAKVRLADIAHAIARLNRYTGHIVPEHYSVAEHSVEVAKRLPQGLAWRGLLHDAREAYIGDCSTPHKHTIRQTLGEEAYRRFLLIEHRVQAAIAEALETPDIPSADAEVKRADLGMLRIERAQVMAEPVGWEWDGSGIPHVSDSVLRCDAPMWAEGRWLMHARNLAPTPAMAREAAEAWDSWNKTRLGPIHADVSR